MNIPYVMKKCNKCGKWLVASTVNFHKRKTGKYGLQNECKECKKNRNNPVNTDPSITKVCNSCGRIFPATEEYFRKSKTGKYGLRGECKECQNKYQKRYEEAHKDKKLEYNKQYYQDNRDKMMEYNKQWYKDNRDKVMEYNKQYYQDNRDKALEYFKQYNQSPQGQIVAFNNRQKRRTKEEAQGTGITKDQWVEMMSFFDWKCAYSGEYLGGNDNSFNRTIDHIVPLNSGGDNMIWNCVPMTRSLNCSKHTKDMEEWYKGQDCYSEARLAKIYEWQEYARQKWKNS